MSSEKPQRRPRIQFSLRAMLVLTLLVAAYAAGWISHREWNQRNLIHAGYRGGERTGEGGGL